MTNLNYKDESNCILLAEVFDGPKTGCWKMKGKEKPTKGRSRKERRKGVFNVQGIDTLHSIIR